MTAAKVAAARRQVANRRQPGQRMTDAIRSATAPAAAFRGTGKKPTPGQAFAAARRAVTGDTPTNRGPVRRAVAGLVAGGIAAGAVAYKRRALRKKMAAARVARNERAISRMGNKGGTPLPTSHGVGTHVRRPGDGSVAAAPSRLPAPPPTGRRNTTNPGQQATDTQGMITMVHPLLAISEDFLAAAHRNQPEGMLQVTSEARILAQVMENFTQAMKIRGERAQAYALHPAIKDMYGAVHKAQFKVMESAAEIHPAIEKAHKELLDRLRNPQVGEEMWDVARNRGAE
jgi:hypothetical protein